MKFVNFFHEGAVRTGLLLFRERGISATGVDAITEAAGLTHGAVYSQFGSKEAIAAEAMREALAGSVRLWRRLLERNRRGNAFPAIVAGYLSRDHRDSAGRGCVVAALGSEIAKQPERVRDAFTAELEVALDFLARLMPRTGRSRGYDDAIAAFAFLAGALILARAVNDWGLSNRILEATAKRVIHLARFEGPSAFPGRRVYPNQDLPPREVMRIHGSRKTVSGSVAHRPGSQIATVLAVRERAPPHSYSIPKLQFVAPRLLRSLTTGGKPHGSYANHDSGAVQRPVARA